MIHENTVRINALGEKLFADVGKEALERTFVILGISESTQPGVWVFNCPVFKHTLSFTIIGAALVPVRVNGTIFIYGGGYAVQSVNRLIMRIHDLLKKSVTADVTS